MRAVELARQRRLSNRHLGIDPDQAQHRLRLAPSVGSVVDNRDIPDICLQHMVAVMLLDKTASFRAAHDKPRMRDAAVLGQRSKVTYVPDAALTRLLPARVAIVEVTLNDGTQLSDELKPSAGRCAIR